MKIHFICSGNTYRSRLAEAYLNSLKLKNFKAVSSGTHAKKQPMNVRWYTEKILEEYNLLKYASKTHRQTTNLNLKACDFIVFLEKDVEKFCQAKFKVQKPFLVFHIKDVNSHLSGKKIITSTEKTFQEIKNKIKLLLSKLKT